MDHPDIRNRAKGRAASSQGQGDAARAVRGIGRKVAAHSPQDGRRLNPRGIAVRDEDPHVPFPRSEVHAGAVPTFSGQYQVDVPGLGFPRHIAAGIVQPQRAVSSPESRFAANPVNFDCSILRKQVEV